MSPIDADRDPRNPRHEVRRLLEEIGCGCDAHHDELEHMELSPACRLEVVLEEMWLLDDEGDDEEPMGLGEYVFIVLVLGVPSLISLVLLVGLTWRFCLWAFGGSR